MQSNEINFTSVYSNYYSFHLLKNVLPLSFARQTSRRRRFNPSSKLKSKSILKVVSFGLFDTCTMTDQGLRTAEGQTFLLTEERKFDLYFWKTYIRTKGPEMDTHLKLRVRTNCCIKGEGCISESLQMECISRCGCVDIALPANYPTHLNSLTPSARHVLYINDRRLILKER